MATNVKPSELNYDRYGLDKYDRDIVNSIPGHDALHKEIEKIVGRDFKGRPIRVLELGVGTGLTAERILRITTPERYTVVDFSKTMLDNCRRKLVGFNVQYLEGDYSKMSLPRDNDLVVSVIGLHHQETDLDKKKMFKRIYDLLSSKGAFIFGDLVTFRDKEMAALNDARHFHHLVENATDEKTLVEWAYHHKYLNKLAPLESQIEWLKDVGFRKVKTVYTKFNTALIYAVK